MDESWEKDAGCLRRCAAGDREALRELTQRHGATVNGALHQIIGDAQAADDACVETFAAVWRGARRYNGRISVKVWLYRHAVDVAMRAPLRFDAAGKSRLATALGFLDRRERAVLVLYYAAGLNVHEIAQVLRRPQCWVRYKMTAARRGLVEMDRCLTGSGSF